jgi:hypothetical protein
VGDDRRYNLFGLPYCYDDDEALYCMGGGKAVTKIIKEMIAYV